MSAFSSLKPVILIALLLVIAPPSARADDAQPEKLTVPASERPVTVTRYAAAGEGKRAAVVIVHGINGITAQSMPHFVRYAQALAAQGIDAYIVAYYSRDDVSGMESMERGHIERTRFGPWTREVADVVTYVLARPDSSGRIGLLGLSQGGFLSATESSRDPRISALVVLYGGIPETLIGRVAHLPPLLELHGDADRIVPLAAGNALVAKAKELNVPVQQTVYPGAGHGFDADPNSPDARDATSRAVGFFVQMLK